MLMQGLGHAEKEAAAAKAESEKAQVYSSKLKTTLEKALVCAVCVCMPVPCYTRCIMPSL
jgi:hypothetical protein